MRDVKLHAGIPVKPVYGPGGPRRARRRRDIGQPGRVSVHARHPQAHVPRSAVDDAPVHRLRHARGDQRAIQVPDGARAGRAQRRLRPADAARPRLRRSAGRGRGRSGGDGDRHAGRHGGSLRRHPARPRERLAHDQRHGRADHRHVLRRRRRSRAWPPTASWPRRRTTSSRSSSPAAPGSTRSSLRSAWSATSSSSRARHSPTLNPVSVCGYHIREAGCTTAQEMAYGLAIVAAYVELMLERGMAVDEFAPRLSFNFTCWGQIFEEVAKFRAGRRLYARMMRERFGAQNPRSWMFRSLIGGGGSGFTVQEPENNIVRGAYYRAGAARSGCADDGAAHLRRGLHDPVVEGAAHRPPHDADLRGGDRASPTRSTRWPAPTSSRRSPTRWRRGSGRRWPRRADGRDRRGGQVAAPSRPRSRARRTGSSRRCSPASIPKVGRELPRGAGRRARGRRTLELYAFDPRSPRRRSPSSSACAGSGTARRSRRALGAPPRRGARHATTSCRRSSRR